MRCVNLRSSFLPLNFSCHLLKGRSTFIMRLSINNPFKRMASCDLISAGVFSSILLTMNCIRYSIFSPPAFRFRRHRHSKTWKPTTGWCYDFILCGYASCVPHRNLNLQYANLVFLNKLSKIIINERHPSAETKIPTRSTKNLNFLLSKEKNREHSSLTLHSFDFSISFLPSMLDGSIPMMYRIRSGFTWFLFFGSSPLRDDTMMWCNVHD